MDFIVSTKAAALASVVTEHVFNPKHVRAQAPVLCACCHELGSYSSPPLEWPLTVAVASVVVALLLLVAGWFQCVHVLLLEFWHIHGHLACGSSLDSTASVFGSVHGRGLRPTLAYCG